MGGSGLKLNRSGQNKSGSEQKWTENELEWAKKSDYRQQWAANECDWVEVGGSRQELVGVGGSG